MRNLLVYYFFIFIPFLLFLIAVKSGFISSYSVVGWLFCYVIYRQFTDVWRLTTIGVIKKATWKALVDPFLQVKYFKELYWMAK